jgi:hypothetical protein
MKSSKIAFFVPMTLALAISQSLHASSLNEGNASGLLIGANQGQHKDKVAKGPASQRFNVERNHQGVRELDMTNVAQYSMIKSRLDQAGRPAVKFPQLHETLNIKRVQQVAAAKQGTVTQSASLVEEPDIIKNAHLFLDMNVAVSDTNNTPYLLIRAQSTVYGGTEMTYIDLLLEDEFGGQLAPMGSTFNVGEGKDTIAYSIVSLDTLKYQYPDLETIYASSYVETEEADGTITSALKYTEYPFSWASVEAAYGHLMSNKKGDIEQGEVSSLTTSQTVSSLTGGQPSYVEQDPRDINGDTFIKVCLNRSHSDCDYVADQYGNANELTYVNIPFKGSMTVGHEIVEIYPTDLAPENRPNGVDTLTNIYLQEGLYGGATKQSYKGLDNTVKNFSDYLDFEVDSINKVTTITWDIPRSEGRFGNANLFSNIEAADWHITFAVSGFPNFQHGRGGTARPFQVSLTSEVAAQFGNYYSPILQKIKLGYSCLAKGTLITMADGSQKPIDKILAGEMVMGASAESSAAPEPMRVADVSIGIEALQMYRVKVQDGKNILMTETHPVSTSNRGVVWAKELKEGDRILTKDGSQLITKIKTEKYKDNVYNLKLEPSHDSLITDGASLGMFANGMLVGDLDTQDEFNYKDQGLRMTPQEQLQRMPEKWKADFISNMDHKAE